MKNCLKFISIFALSLVTLSNTASAKEVTTSAELVASSFCKNLQCQSTDPFKDANGDTSILYRIKKDPSTYDLLGVIKEGKLVKVTFKFMVDGTTPDKELVKSLLESVTGAAPDTTALDKLLTAGNTKTTRVQFASAEKIKFGTASAVAGKILSKPTFQVELGN